VVLFYVIYRLVGRGETVVNFMIATEGEMKKVSWSNRREVIGATKVVIVTTLALAAILFMVDIAFMMAFSAIDVLQIDLLGNLFGGDEGS
jgi:preprotein translocase SecE subunit